MKTSLFYTLLLVFFVGYSSTLSAQITCNGVRYLNKTFTVNTAPVTVQYGRNTAINGTLKQLKMDIYQPDGDTEAARPVLVFAFGGSFIGGTRTDAGVVSICKAFAARGYVTCAIDYRIYDGIPIPLPDSFKFANIVVKAVGDVKAAVRYLRKTAANGNPYRIDSDYILAGGISAGGIATIHAAYLRSFDDAPTLVQTYVTSNGGIHGDTDDPAGSAMMYSDSINGVVNYFGGLYRKEILDAGEVPIVSIHGTADNVVPYNFGYANVSGFNIITINGSGRNHERATAVGVPNQLISVPGGGHGDFLSNAMWSDSMDVTSTKFVYNNVLCKLVSTRAAAAVEPVFSLAPNPTSDVVMLTVANVDNAYTVSVSDMLGRIVYSSTAPSRNNSYMLPTDSLPNGAYIVTVRSVNDAKNAATKKLIVAH